jgi:lipoyl(octanoyl) transferase
MTNNTSSFEYRDLGLISYKEAWDYQEKLFQELMRCKVSGICESAVKKNYLLFCEHPHVYTLGKSGHDQNLLINETFLAKKGIEFFRINRGGDITYHGPGQIVGYPILDLEDFGLGIRSYIHLLEESVILLLKEYGILSGRLEGATGVWLDAEVPGRARKICAIGVRASRHITMHGFAFNVGTDLAYYQYINPCGFTDKGVTSMEKELGGRMDVEEVKNKLKSFITALLLVGNKNLR